jgi:ADP-heptose:LPS heptosyltransferase
MASQSHFKPSSKILAIKLRQIGDTVLWTSALTSLKSLIPDGSIDVLVLKGTEKVLKGFPGIRKIHTLKDLSFGRLALKLWDLRKEKYDLALGFHATTSLCRLIPVLGAKVKVLHHHSWQFTPSQSDIPIAEPGKLENVLLRDHQILKALGYLESPPPTKLFVTENEKQWATQRLKDHFAKSSQKKLVHLHQSVPSFRVFFA